MNRELVVYSPESELRNPRKLLSKFVSDLVVSWDLIWILFTRDLKARYRQDFLSYFWLIAPPIANTGAWVFLNTQNLVTVAETSIPYPLFVFVGQIMWEAFVGGIRSARTGLGSAGSVMTRLKVPLEGFLFAQILTQSFEILVKVLMLIPFLYLWGDGLHLTFLLFLLCIFTISLLGTSIGMAITPVGFLFKDIYRGIEFAMPLLKFTAPVVFPVATTGIAAMVMQNNPVTPLIQAGRDWVTVGQSGHGAEMMMIAMGSLVLFCGGSLLLKLVMPRLVERMGM